MNAQLINSIVDHEIDNIQQADLATLIKKMRISPRLEMRPWDYGKPNDEFPCWFVVEFIKSNTAIAYCDKGFGPSYPWGIMFISGPHRSMGMDSAWYANLEDAVRDSGPWTGNNPAGYEVQ